MNKFVRAFHKLDTNGTGSISKSTLTNFIAIKHIDIDSGTISEIFEEMDSDKGATIDKQEFNRYLEKPHANKKLLDFFRTICQVLKIKSPEEEEEENIPETDEELMARLKLTPATFEKFIGIFDLVDRDKSGTIDSKEFCNFLRLNGMLN